jgi:hypothetical protein
MVLLLLFMCYIIIILQEHAQALALDSIYSMYNYLAWLGSVLTLFGYMYPACVGDFCQCFF